MLNISSPDNEVLTAHPACYEYVCNSLASSLPLSVPPI